MFISFLLFLIATFAAAGVITASMSWLLPGGLCAMALAFLWGGFGNNNFGNWNRRV
jgi:hypothetical protein